MEGNGGKRESPSKVSELYYRTKKHQGKRVHSPVKEKKRKETFSKKPSLNHFQREKNGGNVFGEERGQGKAAPTGIALRKKPFFFTRGWGKKPLKVSRERGLIGVSGPCCREKWEEKIKKTPLREPPPLFGETYSIRVTGQKRKLVPQ